MKDRSHLVKKRITVTRNGKTFLMTVWVKPEDRHAIPTIELPDLPEHLRIENYSTKQFKALLFLKFVGNRVKNRHTGANILIPKSGIKHSLSNRYPYELQNFTRASIWQLNKILNEAIRIKSETDKEESRYVLQIDTYLIAAKHDNKQHFVKVVVKNFKEKGEIFYDHLIIKKEVAAHQDVIGKIPMTDPAIHNLLRKTAVHKGVISKRFGRLPIAGPLFFTVFHFNDITAKSVCQAKGS